ncbi:hypothetical protein GCM10010532_045750 [Dactylosporangium siamense]|uniref:Uncharacterized protein n=2 Tax=Dactylosporangium siamense TaxID=685454 RepID=A0A919PZJ8_9ACTN|nr:hypothetical protein Dsi01nite_094940 [Dactylosporangium siamense]
MIHTARQMSAARRTNGPPAPTVAGMTRKLAVTACLTLALALTACMAEPFEHGDGKRIKVAVEGLFGELERADYTAAAAHWCTAARPAKPLTADQLKTDFESLQRPWRIKLVSSQHTPGSTGVANLTLTDGGGAEHPYNVDFTMAGGTTEICTVDTGTISIDVDI